MFGKEEISSGGLFVDSDQCTDVEMSCNFGKDIDNQRGYISRYIVPLTQLDMRSILRWGNSLS
jgi:hypothetical protein